VGKIMLVGAKCQAPLHDRASDFYVRGNLITVMASVEQDK